MLSAMDLTPDEKRMIDDAPAEFFPRWMDVVADPQLRAAIQVKYMRLKADHDDGEGLPVGKDMILRRIVYLDRIAQRLEASRERILNHIQATDSTQRDDHQVQLGWHRQLMQHEQTYERITKSMYDMLRKIGIEGDGRRAKGVGRTKRRAFPIEGVVISD